MSADIDSYIGRDAAWHTLGMVTGKLMSFQEILDKGYLNYTVYVDQKEYFGKKINSWGTFRMNPEFNGDKSKAIFLADVGKNYNPIPHARGFEMLDALVQSVDGAHYETAGSLGLGETVWGLANLAEVIRIGDDIIMPRLAVTTSYDGMSSFRVFTCNERIVCRNTLNIALSQGLANMFKIRHSRNAEEKIKKAIEALSKVKVEFRTVEDKLKFLAGRMISKKETLTGILDRLFPMSKEDENGVKQSSTRRDNMIMRVLQNFEDNDGNAFPEQRGTAYNLLNAFTQFVDHQRSTKGDNRDRAEQAMFGAGSKDKANALAVIEEFAKDMPEKQVERIQVATVGNDNWMKDMGVIF